MNKKGLPQDYKVTVEELLKYNEKWDTLDKMVDYRAQETTLDLLFHTLCPQNKCLEHILLKIVALNDFYSTYIFDVYSVARHFMSIQNLDDLLKAGDVELVDRLSNVPMKKGSIKHFFSFATKYCSHHYPDKYPIYDLYVCDVLKALRKRDKFSKFLNDDLKNFKKFKEVIDDFTNFYGLIDPKTGKPFTYKEVDRYLWLLGKNFFNAYDDDWEEE